MQSMLSSQVQNLLREPNYAIVATINPNGTPHLSIVWIDSNGKYVSFNTRERTNKVQNLRRNANVAILIFDRNDIYRWASVEGRVKTMTTEGSIDHMHQLSQKYEGCNFQNLKPGDVRLKVIIEPRRVICYGLDN